MKSQITEERILWEKRSRYNPLINLTPQSLRTALDSFQAGYLSAAARIWEEIERKDGTIIAARSKRKKSVARLSWNIVSVSAASEKTAQAHAQILEDFYNNILWTHACETHRVGGFSRLVESMLDSVGKGYSVNEIIWRPNPAQRNLRALFKFVPLWFFENTTGHLRFLAHPNALYGDSLKPNKWLITAAEIPLMEASSVYYLMKNMSLADWLVFSRRFGSALANLTTNEPFGSERWREMASALSQIDNESSFMSGSGDKLELLQANGQNSPFKEIIDHLTRLVITMWLGSDLATLSSKDGAGASLQGESSDIIEDDDCLLIEETLESVSRFVINYHFGNVEPAAYLQFKRTDSTDKNSELEIIERVARLGVPVPVKDICERFAVRMPDEGEDSIRIGSETFSPAANSGDTLSPSGSEDIVQLARARGGDIAAVVNALEKIISETSDNETYLSALEIFETDLPKFFSGGENEAEALAKILEKATALGIKN